MSLQNELEAIYNKFRKFEVLLDKSTQNQMLKTSEDVKNVIDILEVNLDEFKKLEDTGAAEMVSYISNLSEKLIPDMYLKLRMINFSK